MNEVPQYTLLACTLPLTHPGPPWWDFVFDRNFMNPEAGMVAEASLIDPCPFLCRAKREQTPIRSSRIFLGGTVAALKRNLSHEPASVQWQFANVKMLV